MLKASAGGGGRGIRLVSAPNEMTQAYALAVAEGEASFGDGSVYMEKYVHPARHIEVQVLGRRGGQRGLPGGAGLLGPAPPPEAH